MTAFKPIIIVVVIAAIVLIGLGFIMFKSREEVKPTASEALKSIIISSSAFENEGMIPKKYTCEGEDASPPLSWNGVPENAQSLVLIVYDPDAPMGTFYHWILYNIPPNVNSLPENIPKDPNTPYGLQGRNDFGKIGYGGPCPPPGSKHRYYFLILALDTKLDLEPGAKAKDVLKAAEGHILAKGEYMGYYGR